MTREPSTREHLLALDLGTTSVRALVVHANGRIVARASQPLATHFPAPGHVEQDPADLLDASRDVLRAAVSRAGLRAPDLAGLGIVTQRSTTLVWESGSGRPLAPALSWQDQRTAPRVAELVAAGIPVNTLASATKLEWLVANVAEVREAAARGRLRAGTPDTWLTERLCAEGAFVTDPGQASCTGLFDGARGRWLPAALDLFGVDLAWLPEVVATAATVGETSAALLGSPVPVASRAGDQQAASFAQGVHAPGDAKLTLGTAAMLDVHIGDVTTASASAPGAYALSLWKLAGRTAACLEGTVITAGAAVDWLVAAGLLASAADIDPVASEVGDAEGVAFVPALQGLGTPHLDDAARGLFGGLTRGSKRAHLVRAVLDGISQRCVDLVDTLPLAPGPLRVDGGLGRSRVALQTIADLSGRELWRADETETTALGAALLAGLAVGLYPDADAACAGVAAPERIPPRLAADERESRRERWRTVLARARR